MWSGEIQVVEPSWALYFVMCQLKCVKVEAQVPLVSLHPWTERGKAVKVWLGEQWLQTAKHRGRQGNTLPLCPGCCSSLLLTLWKKTAQVFPDASLYNFPPVPDRRLQTHPSVCAENQSGTTENCKPCCLCWEGWLVPWDGRGLDCGSAVQEEWCCVWSQKTHFETTMWEMQNTLLPFPYHRRKPLFVSDICESL